jgi:trypsin
MITGLFIVLANLAIAFAGRPMPIDLQEKWGFLMKEDPPMVKVVGGTPVANGGRPFQILLRRNGAFTCGGSFIGARTVLTAAHCVDGNEGSPQSFTISYNSLTQSGGQIIQVSKIVKHASYSSSSIDYDYAILHLASAFTPATNAATIALADDGHDPVGSTQVIVSGFGRTVGGGAVSQNLLQASLNVVDRTTCGSRWGRTISARMVCAHSTTTSACNGDSGGPLTSGSTLVGVVSWGSSSCLHTTLPNVYARVGAVRAWIDANSIG